MSFDLSGQALDRSRPMRDQIYPLVRNLILTGQIGPGETVDEKKIATQLKVSRTPVREAVKRLSDESLVEVIAQSSTRAARIDLREISEAYLIRRALELESVAQAASRMKPVHAERLEDILLVHSRMIERRSYAEAIAQDDAFHHAIALISDLPRLWRAIEVSKAQLDRCRHIALPKAGQGEATLAQHRAIIRALKSKDPEKARAAMRKHLTAAYEAAVDVVQSGLSG
jgi:DNA-binding GntR family transcriptional regulator